MDYNSKAWRYFGNGEYRVDYVLAYQKEGKPEDVEKRNTFEENLEAIGLLLEKETNQRIHFVKIYLPTEVLCQYAEILKLRLPIKYQEDVPQQQSGFSSTIAKLLQCCFRMNLDPEVFPPKKYQLTAEYNREKNYLFDIDSPDFFNERIRITIAAYILDREKFGESDQEQGVRKLISEGVYKAAYPLHDGDLHDSTSKRYKLLHHWAAMRNFFKYQPADDIRDYFGVKIAFYFVWLGFYTQMLIPAAAVGICGLIYAAFASHSDALTRDICNSDAIMCPRCDKVCDYWELKDSCLFARIQYFIDSPLTTLFAIFMSFWSVLFLELWKRYSAEVKHKWGISELDADVELPRAEYVMNLKEKNKTRKNSVTNLEEPAVSFWKEKLPSVIISFSIALVWALVALGVVFGVVIYRMSLITSETLYSDKVSYRIYILPVTAALINLIGITILNILYRKLAVWLTNKEFQRTQSEYDDSLSLKIYMFEFVNYYSSIFYIAFLKGKFVGYPAKYNRIFGIRQEECNPGGCLMELTIQLIIVMVGKQALKILIEMSLPFLKKMYKSIVGKREFEDADSQKEAIFSLNQWTEDYKLLNFESSNLFSEYLEIVLQYGFVTIFVTAFPLAPLFALINNIFQMRLDAKKYLTYFRRPIPHRVKNIGVWFGITSTIGSMSVVSNAFIIAFSSNFIPRLVYQIVASPDGTDEGYLDYSLAFFDVNDLEQGTAPQHSKYNISVCQFNDYRNSYNVTGSLVKYKRPLIYWHILAARLAFVVVYQNLVSFVVAVVRWTVPDVPKKLNDQMKKESYKTLETIIKYETQQAREKRRRRRRREVTSSE